MVYVCCWRHVCSPGGIPARNAKGERLLLFIGIIDILQSYRLKKKLEHTWKSMIHDGVSHNIVLTQASSLRACVSHFFRILCLYIDQDSMRSASRISWQRLYLRRYHHVSTISLSIHPHIYGIHIYSYFSLSIYLPLLYIIRVCSSNSSTYVYILYPPHSLLFSSCLSQLIKYSTCICSGADGNIYFS